MPSARAPAGRAATARDFRMTWVMDSLHERRPRGRKKARGNAAGFADPREKGKPEKSTKQSRGDNARSRCMMLRCQRICMLQCKKKIGSAHVCNPGTNAHIGCRLWSEQKNKPK